MEVDNLVNAKPQELYTLVGMYALPLVDNPNDVLEQGRDRKYYQMDPDIQGPADFFELHEFRKKASIFFELFFSKLKGCICGNDEVTNTWKQRLGISLETAVAFLSGYLAANLPELSPFSPLLIILCIMIYRSGFNSFCDADSMDDVFPAG